MTNEIAVQFFTESLLELISEKLSLYKALKVIAASKVTSEKICKTADEIAEKISKGERFSSALKKSEKINFDRTYVCFISFSEETGNLTNILEFLLERCKRKEESSKQVISALIYPAFVVFLLTAMMIAFVYLGRDKISDFGFDFIFQKNTYIKLLLSIIPVLAFSIWFINRLWKKSSDNILYEAFLASGFLLKEGMNLSSAIEAAALTAEKDLKVYDMFIKAGESLEYGMDLRNSFCQVPKANRKLIERIEMYLFMAEETGSKDTVLLRIAEMIKKSDERERKLMLSLIEPVLIGTTGFLFLSIVIQFILPFFSGMELM